MDYPLFIIYRDLAQWIRATALTYFSIPANKNMIKEHWLEENIRKAIKGAECKTDILVNLGLYSKNSNPSSHFRTLDKYCLLYGINIKDLKIKIPRGGYKKGARVFTNNEEMFTENSLSDNGSVKKRIISQNLLEYKCIKCQCQGKWMGEEIVLQLDHINGNRCDNRLENLRFLCPNCHSQTNTYAGKKTKKNFSKVCKVCNKDIYKSSRTFLCRSCGAKERVNKTKKNMRPQKEKLLELIKTIPLSEIGRMYGFSDNTIRKWCIVYEIDYKKLSPYSHK